MVERGPARGAKSNEVIAKELERVSEKENDPSKNIRSTVLGPKDTALRKFAQDIVTREYSNRFGRDPRTEESVIGESAAKEKLFDIPYDGESLKPIDHDGDALEKTILAGIPVEQQEGNRQFQVAATIRLLLGDENQEGRPPIEAMSLLDLPQDYPHRQEKTPDKKVAELGRLAYVEPQELGLDLDAGKEKEFKTAILKNLTLQAAQVCKENEIEDMYAIMPQTILEMFRTGGIEPEHIPGARLRQHDTLAEATYDNFPKYWKNPKRGVPQVYRWKIANLLEGEQK